LRLSLTTNVYVTTSDVTAAGTLYWTTIISGGTGVVTGYNGSALARKTVAQKSLSLTLTVDKVYDVFYDYDGDVLALSAAWSDNVTRTDALANEQGATVLGSDHTKLWLGAIVASGTNTTEDSEGKRYVANAYNLMQRTGFISSSSSHTYSGANVTRAWNNSVANVIQFLLPVSRDLTMTLNTAVHIDNGGGGYAVVSYALDSVTTEDTRGVLIGVLSAPAVAPGLSINYYFGSAGTLRPTLGWHYIAAVERSFDTQTFETFSLSATYMN
jgi:hypothetical protein